MSSKFTVHNLGTIGNVNVDFRDLTIIVCSQASGKSLFWEL